MAAEHAHSDDDDGGKEIKPLHFFFPTITPEEGRTLDNETFLISERRVAVMRLYRERKSMRQIAEELKVSHNTVWHDIDAVMQGYKLMAAKDAKEHIAEMLSQLAHRECQIEAAWHKSIGEAVETSATKRKSASGDQDTTAVKKKNLLGNPMYTAQLLAIWDRRARLLGLLSKSDVAADTRVVELQKSGNSDLAGMSDSEIDNAIHKILEGLRPATPPGTGEGEATPGT